jgi:hypothetical protein
VKETRMKIFCVECKTKRKARLTNGQEIYPHRQYLNIIPFWKCDVCKNYVGCHHKALNIKTRPLGIIPNQMLRIKRQEIHNILDPIWKTKKTTRKRVYQYLSNKIGKEYHTGDIRTVTQANRVILFLNEKFNK